MSEFTDIILRLLWRFYPIAWLTTAIVRGLPAIIPVMPTTTIFGVRPPTTIPTTTIFSFGGSDDFRLRQDPTTIVSLDAGDDDDFRLWRDLSCPAPPQTAVAWAHPR